jgi:hypothetical protein
VTAEDGFTRIERKVLAKEWAKVAKNKARYERLSSITRQVLNPVTGSEDYTLIPAATNPYLTQINQYEASIKQYQYEAMHNK